nr:DNA methyltransferase [Pyrinomonadaceae bacterium]
EIQTKNDIVIDFFGGLGTTAHAVINLNREDGGRRKYILVEANDYFHTVILPRVKKVVFSDKWKDGKAKADGKGVSHFCKYFALEQYEDTLRRASYVNDSETDAPSFFDNPFEKSPFSAYVFLRDKKMSDALKIDYEADKITVDFQKLYPEIDWAETLSCIKGKFIKSVTTDSVTFADNETIKFAEMDYRDILPLIWWDK